MTEGDTWTNDQRVTEREPKIADCDGVPELRALSAYECRRKHGVGANNSQAWARQQIAERVKVAARILELDGLLKRHPRELFGGQRQRWRWARDCARSGGVLVDESPL